MAWGHRGHALGTRRPTGGTAGATAGATASSHDLFNSASANFMNRSCVIVTPSALHMTSYVCLMSAKSGCPVSSRRSARACTAAGHGNVPLRFVGAASSLLCCRVVRRARLFSFMCGVGALIRVCLFVFVVVIHYVCFCCFIMLVRVLAVLRRGSSTRRDPGSSHSGGPISRSSAGDLHRLAAPAHASCVVSGVYQVACLSNSLTHC